MFLARLLSSENQNRFPLSRTPSSLFPQSSPRSLRKSPSRREKAARLDSVRINRQKERKKERKKAAKGGLFGKIPVEIRSMDGSMDWPLRGKVLTVYVGTCIRIYTGETRPYFENSKYVGSSSSRLSAVCQSLFNARRVAVIN